MPLSEDQRALLRLLLGGDTYEQVADVLGTSASEVRERAGQAVAELERSGEDPKLEDAVRQRIRELEGGTDGEASPSTAQGPAPQGPGLPRVAWITIAGVLVAIVAAFLVVQLSGDSNDSKPTQSSAEEDVIEIKLDPVGGSGASGSAAIVRVSDRPAVDVKVSGLAPTEPSETYVLWILGSGGKGLPIAFRAVGKDGRFIGRTQVPSAAGGLLPSVEFIDLSLARKDQVGPAVREAAENGILPSHIGRSVARGRLAN